MDRKEIYQLIVDNTVLSPEHRVELLEKRGIPFEVSDFLKFRTCGPEFKKHPAFQKIPDEIAYTLTQERCQHQRDLGWTMDSHEGDPCPDKKCKFKLGKPRIFIPYLSPEGQVLHLRPHKSGFSETPHQIYIPYPVMQEDRSTLVLAEGEFKAVASCLMGRPAISVQGIATFSRKNLPRLMEALYALECKEVIVCFDNEIKDDPRFENYKEDYTDRYDTTVYEYVMAKAIGNYKQGVYKIKTRIARLKGSWRVNGKADIDGVLAQGIDALDYQNIVDNARSPEETRKSWNLPEKHVACVERKINRFFYSGPIEKKMDGYYIVDYQKGAKEDSPKARRLKKITNFKIDLVFTAYSENKPTERHCQLRSNYRTSVPAIIKAEVMVSRQAFQKMCYDLGDFEFSGSDSDLQALWSYIFLHQDGREINRVKSYGFNEEDQAWFFNNGAYKNNKFYPLQGKQIFIEEQGYMLPKKTISDEISPPNLSIIDSDFNLNEIFDNFQKIVRPEFAKIIFGWTLGNFFLDKILKQWKVYPFLFLHGTMGGGKSTLANFIMSFFGFSMKGIPLANSTVAGIKRSVANYSMIPLWLEEFRNNDPKIQDKIGLLRSIYDRSTLVQATRAEDEIKTHTARASLIISGEEQPRDAALNSRCILIPRFDNEDHKKNMLEFEWIENNKNRFNGVGHRILTHQEIYWEKIKKRVDEYLEGFRENLQNIDFRNRIHMSVVAGVCDVFLGETQDFEDFIGKHTLERSEMIHSKQALYIFFHDLMTMQATKEIQFKFIRKMNDKSYDNPVALWFSGAFDFWEKRYKMTRADIPASSIALLEHLKAEPYYIKPIKTRLDGKVLHCYLLNSDHKKFPQVLKDILENDEAPIYRSQIEDPNPKNTKLIFGEK